MAENNGTTLVYSSVVMSGRKKYRIVISGRNPDNSANQVIGDRQAVFLMKNQANFKNSGMPCRVMYFDADGMWVEYPPEIVNRMKHRLKVGIPMVEVSLDGKNVLVDFYRMLEVDLDSGYERSVAWVDIDEKCYFPFVFVNSSHNYEDVFEGFGESEGVGEESGKKRKIEGEEIEANRAEKSTFEVGSSSNVGTVGEINEGVLLWPKWPKARVLNEEEREYGVIKRLFLNGMGGENSTSTITRMHTCLRYSARHNARKAAFDQQVEMVEKARGNANVEYAWYGTSSRALERILASQVLVPDEMEILDPPRVGAYLTPAMTSARLSVSFCERDDNGEKHLILCRVILGRSEEVTVPPTQQSPSSPAYDTGVDSLAEPSLFVVWPADMSTHITIEAVVSFKTEYVYTDAINGSPVLPPPDLPEPLASFMRALPPAKAPELLNLYNSRKNMGRVEYKRKLRALLVDKLVREFIDQIRGI